MKNKQLRKREGSRLRRMYLDDGNKNNINEAFSARMTQTTYSSNWEKLRQRFRCNKCVYNYLNKVTLYMVFNFLLFINFYKL